MRNFKGDLYEYLESEPHLTRVYSGMDDLEHGYSHLEAQEPVGDAAKGGPTVGKSSWVHRGGPRPVATAPLRARE